MRNTVAAALSLVSIILIRSEPAAGQQAIQQPVVSSTSISTTVSVPDRGSAFLGGVSSAQSARAQYGPLRSGAFRGLARQATSVSTSVYIHDLHAMDEALLNSAPESTDQPHRAASPQPAVTNSTVEAKSTSVSPAEKAVKFEKLALKAEAAGKPGVAKLHWQAAARYGSRQAECRLAELTVATSPSTAH